MGMIDERELQDPELPEGYRPRVVVKFDDDLNFDEVRLEYIDYDTPETKDWLRQRVGFWTELEHVFQADLSLNRLITSLGPEEILELTAGAISDNAGYRRNFLTYFAIDCPEHVEPNRLAEMLNSLKPTVEVAYVDAEPSAPPALISPGLPGNPRIGRQNYLKVVDTQRPGHPARPAGAFHVNGIGSRYAWCFKGGDGSGVRFADVEQGWSFEHEDLVNANFENGTLAPWHGVNRTQKAHGTAILGELFAVPNNALGGVGTVPGASGLTISEWEDERTKNIVAAIFAAINYTREGDVILLETQAKVAPPGGGHKRFLPCEVLPGVFDAILLASLSNRIVIEPAANGAVSLDDEQFLPRFVAPDWNFPMIELYSDSGAIMVGASKSGSRERASFSNFGERVDCFAVGEFVDTAWSSPGRPYTNSNFSGTSAAAPIVTGAAISIQGIKKACAGGVPFSSLEMRAILKDSSLNTPSNSPADLIGVMPDLVNIITSTLGVGQDTCPADDGQMGTCLDYAFTA